MESGENFNQGNQEDNYEANVEQNQEVVHKVGDATTLATELAENVSENKTNYDENSIKGEKTEKAERELSPEQKRDKEMLKAMAEVGNWQRRVAARHLNIAEKILELGGVKRDDGSCIGIIPVLDENTGEIIRDIQGEDGEWFDAYGHPLEVDEYGDCVYRHGGHALWEKGDGSFYEHVGGQELEYGADVRVESIYGQKYNPDFVKQAKALIEDAKNLRDRAEENEGHAAIEYLQNTEEAQAAKEEIKELRKTKFLKRELPKFEK